MEDEREGRREGRRERGKGGLEQCWVRKREGGRE